MNKVNHFFGARGRRMLEKQVIRIQYPQCQYDLLMLLCGMFVLTIASTIGLVPTVVAQTNIPQANDVEKNTMQSNIADDEVVQFFRTTAIFNQETQTWRAPIHGWAYEPQQSKFRKSIFSFVLKTKYNLQIDDDAQPYYDRRLNLLIADNERGKTPPILLADGTVIATVAPSVPNGHFQTEIELSDAVVSTHRQGNTLAIKTFAKDGREFFGEILLVAPEGISVISDIDDTIKVSDVLNHQQLIDYTFLKPFESVPGMSDAYQRLKQSKVDSFHFVSSSPWQLYQPLQEFVDMANFPKATFSLKAIRFRDMTLFDLFKPGTATKPLQIQKLLQQFPQRKFILIGDSGEQDPEVYAGILSQYPDRIDHIFIRNITAEDLGNARMQAIAAQENKWTLFEDPNDILP